MTATTMLLRVKKKMARVSYLDHSRPGVCLLQLVLTSHRRLCLTGWSLTLLVCMGVLFKSIDCGASAGF